MARYLNFKPSGEIAFMGQEQTTQLKIIGVAVLPDFPIPQSRINNNHTWDELVLGVNGHKPQTLVEITEYFWNNIIPILADVRDVNIVTPMDEAWYHFRRRCLRSNTPDTLKYAEGRIEIFRSKVGSIGQDTKKQIRKLAERFGVIVCAGWWPSDLEGYHPSFRSLLQKLSYLRGRKGMCFPLNLTRDDRASFDLMVNEQQPWYGELLPWIEMIRSGEISKEKVREYAHWFGHILSGWDLPQK